MESLSCGSEDDDSSSSSNQSPTDGSGSTESSDGSDKTSDAAAGNSCPAGYNLTHVSACSEISHLCHIINSGVPQGRVLEHCGDTRQDISDSETLFPPFINASHGDNTSSVSDLDKTGKEPENSCPDSSRCQGKDMQWEQESTVSRAGHQSKQGPAHDTERVCEEASSSTAPDHPARAKPRSDEEDDLKPGKLDYEAGESDAPAEEDNERVLGLARTTSDPMLGHVVPEDRQEWIQSLYHQSSSAECLLGPSRPVSYDSGVSSDRDVVGGWETPALRASSVSDFRSRRTSMPTRFTRQSSLYKRQNLRPSTVSGSRVVRGGSWNIVPAAPSQVADDRVGGEERFSFCALSVRDKLILFSLGLTDFLSMLSYSLMAPFFPSQAMTKGMSVTVSGWVFGVFALAQVFCSPLAGKLLPYFGTRFLYNAGMFFSAGCIILFGLLTYVPSDAAMPLVFTTLAFTLRVGQAVGSTMFTTASFAITAATYPENAATVFGILETFSGVGLMIGPAVGGVLYEWGGFVTPFAVVGSIMLGCVPLNQLLVKRLPVELTELGGESGKGGSMMKLLRVWRVQVALVCVVITAAVWALMDPVLQPRLSQFDLSPSMIGLIFLLSSSLYAISSPLWGALADRLVFSDVLLLPGFLLLTVGLLLLAPSQWIGFPSGYSELWLIIVALVLLGLAGSLALVPTFDVILDAADREGMEDNVGTFGVISGLWTTAYAMGDFIGPSVGGFLTERVGFSWCMSYSAAATALMSLLLLVALPIMYCAIKRADAISSQQSEVDEQTPLLHGLLRDAINTDLERSGESGLMV